MYIIITLPGLALAVWAQARVQGAFERYSRVRTWSGMTGAEVARRFLHEAGIYDVRVERVPGVLTDHYDPRGRVLRLSEAVYDSTSVAALGVAAHEAGHALQHALAYPWLGLRTAVIPATRLGAQLAFPLFFLGLMLQGTAPGGLLLRAGIALFLAAVAFQLITLPVEFDASRRALEHLEHGGLLRAQEALAAREVLAAAAWTYVAAALTAVLTLVYMLLRAGRRRE